MAGNRGRWGRRARTLAAGGLGTLLALVWWLGRSPGGASAPDVGSPRPELPAQGDPAWPRAIQPPPPRFAPPPGAPRDPLVVAIPSDARKAFILQVNSLAHAPLGRLWLGCLAKEERELLGLLERAGIDPLVDVDRLALTQDGEGLAVASGFFARANPLTLVESLPFSRPQVQAVVEPYGPEATLFTTEFCYFECWPMELAKWGDATLALGEPKRVRSFLGRLQGRSSEPPLALPEDAFTADIFGVTSVATLASWLDLNDPVLDRWLSALPARAEIRVDAMRDVRATARVTVEDPAAADDLAELFEAAVARAASKARAAGNPRADLLERLAVIRGRGEFTLSLDLPVDALERQFQGCSP